MFWWKRPCSYSLAKTPRKVVVWGDCEDGPMVRKVPRSSNAEHGMVLRFSKSRAYECCPLTRQRGKTKTPATARLQTCPPYLGPGCGQFFALTDVPNKPGHWISPFQTAMFGGSKKGKGINSRSSSREVRIRLPFLFVVYFSRGPSPKNGVRKGPSRQTKKPTRLGVAIAAGVPRGLPPEACNGFVQGLAGSGLAENTWHPQQSWNLPPRWHPQQSWNLLEAAGTLFEAAPNQSFLRAETGNQDCKQGTPFDAP